MNPPPLNRCQYHLNTATYWTLSQGNIFTLEVSTNCVLEYLLGSFSQAFRNSTLNFSIAVWLQHWTFNIDTWVPCWQGMVMSIQWDQSYWLNIAIPCQHWTNMSLLKVHYYTQMAMLKFNVEVVKAWENLFKLLNKEPIS
jgi:hypothetical protein